MEEKIIFRQEVPSDYQSVFDVNLSAFDQANEARLVEALRKNSSVFVPELSIVAELNEKVIGHILFTKIAIVDSMGKSHESLALAPMSVLSEFQKRGVGGLLIKRGFEVASQLNYSSVIVLGHEHYYPKFGFEPAEKWGIMPPFEVPANVFMAIELKEDGLKDISGTVIYPQEFGGV